jgi:hypothetical protein
MSQAKTVKEVLIATEWILNHLGWVQHNYLLNAKKENVNLCSVKDREQEVKSCCLTGAMWLVEASSDLYYQARRHLHNIIHENIVVFNDKHGRTKEEVLELVRKGIESAP